MVAMIFQYTPNWNLNSYPIRYKFASVSAALPPAARASTTCPNFLSSSPPLSI